MWEPRCRTRVNPWLINNATTSRGLSTGSLGISIDSYGLSADEFALKSGLAVFKKHFDDFMKIAMQLVQGSALRMRARGSRERSRPIIRYPRLAR